MSVLKCKFNKHQKKLLWKQSRRELVKQLTELRLARDWSLADVNLYSNIPLSRLEAIETGRGDLILNHIIILSRLFGKRLRIELIDPTAEDLAVITPLIAQNE